MMTIACKYDLYTVLVYVVYHLTPPVIPQETYQ